jgi:hypothetical protein
MGAVTGMPNNQPRMSQVNGGWEFNQQKGIVSVINSGNYLNAHAMLVVEYLDQDGKLFVGQYDITAKKIHVTFGDWVQRIMGNSQGVIGKVRCNYDKSEVYTPAEVASQPGLAYVSPYGRDYSSCHSDNWYATPLQIKNLIASIKEKAKEIEDAKAEGKESPYKFQLAGSRRWAWLGGNGGDNCLTWCQARLTEVGIIRNGEGEKKIDIVKAPPQAHVYVSSKPQPA